MRRGTHHFPGDAGKHTDPQGQDCAGRIFEAKQVGVGGVYINRVECTTCHREISSSEDRLMPDTPWTSQFDAAVR
jgi:hypothetical protein